MCQDFIETESLVMKREKVEWADLPVVANLSVFAPENGAPEMHAVLRLQECDSNIAMQIAMLQQAVQSLQHHWADKLQCKQVLKRYFVSDAVNQAQYIPVEKGVAVSIVQQPPLDGSKVSLWVYWVGSCEVEYLGNGTVAVARPGYTHLYTVGLASRKSNAAEETDLIFGRYAALLQKEDCTLKGHCIRTWIFVQNVDVHYNGVVVARKKQFEQMSLTPESHYIASTGIEGRYIYPETLVLMDAYAVKGISEQQVSYLKGLSHLNPTIEYGVTFERATAVDYGDRRHIYVSGTASIDNSGNVVAPYDINKQLDRTLENIQVLLEEGNATMDHVMQMIVYLRDCADYATVNRILDDRFSSVPKVVVWAPVCRPGWLIEIECIAVMPACNPQFAGY